LIDGYWQIRDLNSSNGIKVNGVRCSASWLLPGDEVSIAKHKYEAKYVATGPVPEPLNDFDPSVSLLEKAGLSRRAVEMAEGEDISKSLMEKAGLEHRPRSASPKTNSGRMPTPGKSDTNEKSATSGNRPSTSPGGSAPIPQKKPDSDESIALKWLESDG